jgi:peptide deformylase
MSHKSLSLIYYPDPILTKAALPVEKITADTREIAAQMVDLMVSSSGIGLAGPQVGYGHRIFVTSVSGKAEDARVFINPRLSNFGGLTEMEEGCLSLPEIRVNVKRPESCHVEALDLEGKPFQMDATEMEAKVVQHENDHLDGILIIDKIGKIARIACRKAIKHLEREYEER